jgi:glycosyltransferase involved in cell wall biosynthesis
MKNKISVNLIVKNEEHCVKECLESIKDIAYEIIIVDTGSTDSTKEICKKFTDKIFDFNWNDDFSEVRNYAKQKSSGDWILLIDADEIIIAEEKLKIFELSKKILMLMLLQLRIILIKVLL